MAGAIMTLVQVASFTFDTAPTLHYLYCSIIEVAATVAIVWVAARYWQLDD